MITAQLENISDLQPQDNGDDYRHTYYFKCKCASCGELTKDVCLDVNKEIHGIQPNMAILQCDNCPTKGKLTIIEGKYSPLTHNLAHRLRCMPLPWCLSAMPSNHMILFSENTGKLNLKLWVGGLAIDTNSESFKSYFSQHGTVLSPTVHTDWATMASQGYGFVTFAKKSIRDHVLKMFHEIDNRQVRVGLPIGKPSHEEPVTQEESSQVNPASQKVLSNTCMICWQNQVGFVLHFIQNLMTLSELQMVATLLSGHRV